MEKIEENIGINFMGNQCKDKFKNVIKDYKISKFLLKFILGNMYLIIYKTLYQYE